MRRDLLTILLMSICLAFAPSVSLAKKKSTKSGQVKKKKKKTKKKKRKKTRGSASFERHEGRELGVGVGFVTLLPPIPCANAAMNIGRHWNVGFEVGSFSLGFDDFSADVFHIGGDVKYFFSSAKLFAGAGLGLRTYSIVDPETIGVNGEDTTLNWYVNASQKVFTPKGGWHVTWKNGMAITSSLGLTMPFGTSYSVDRDVESINGLDDDELERKQADEPSNVSKYIESTLPLIEVKIFWFFDVI